MGDLAESDARSMVGLRCCWLLLLVAAAAPAPAPAAVMDLAHYWL